MTTLRLGRKVRQLLAEAARVSIAGQDVLPPPRYFPAEPARGLPALFVMSGRLLPDDEPIPVEDDDR